MKYNKEGLTTITKDPTPKGDTRKRLYIRNILSTIKT